MKNKFITELKQSKHCYEGTDILKNKQNIHDYDKLQEIENGITAYKLSKLYLGKQPYKSRFDFDHFLNIHKYLFEDIYYFAGDIRDEDMFKNNTPYKDGITTFCRVPLIYEQLKYVLDEMRNNARNIKTEEDLISFISEYYLYLNQIHPFREGNGRTIREFLREYVIALNKILKFDDFKIDYDIDKETKESLVKASVLDDLQETKKVFSKMLISNETIKRGGKK